MWNCVWVFFPLKLFDKIQTEGFQMLTSASSLTSWFCSPWPFQSLRWRWEWNRPRMCAAQTLTGSKEGIMSHLRTRSLVWKQALLRWSTVSDHYKETTVRMNSDCFVQKHEEIREIMIATKILAKTKILNSVWQLPFVALHWLILSISVLLLAMNYSSLNSLEKENSRLD